MVEQTGLSGSFEPGTRVSPEGQSRRGDIQDSALGYVEKGAGRLPSALSWFSLGRVTAGVLWGEAEMC